MRNASKRMLLGALLLIAPMWSACEQADHISGIETTDITVAPKRKTVQVVEANVTASGVDGGHATQGKELRLRVGQYQLYVPRGAVSKKTYFVMTVNPGNAVAVSLKAYDPSTWPWQEVKTFRRELFLTLPYSEIDPADIGNESKLLIANISEDGTNSVLELVDTNVDNNAKTVTGKITHFSLWAIAKEIIVGID